MTSPVPENCECNVVGSDFQGIEVSEIDGAILMMSLLEESQGEERDEERLNCLIRSLEAEINSKAMDSQYLTMETDFSVEDGQLCIVGHKEGHDCLVSHDQLGSGCIDMQQVTSSPSADDMNWYLDLCENETDGMIEVGGLSDYSHMYYGVSLEEQGYRSLWQETCDSVIYN